MQFQIQARFDGCYRLGLWLDSEASQDDGIDGQDSISILI